MSLEISVQRRVPPRGIPSPTRLKGYARLALGDHRGECTLRIVDPLESQRLNRDFRGKDNPTNVLSFPYEAPGLIGDVVLCAAVIAREAEEQGKTVPAHWAHLVIHGCLHLIGYDHETPEEAAQMEAREIALLAQLGFANPYE